jgi:hypothetical protein
MTAEACEYCCRGQTAVKPAKRNPQPKREMGFEQMGPENRRLAAF